MTDTKLASVTVRQGLVVTNPAVIKVAKRLRWRPERAVARIQRALPAPLEQEIYLAVGSDFGILPESIAKLLRFYLGEQELQLDDLTPRSIGRNMVTSKFQEFSEFLRECLNLLKLLSKEFPSLSLSIQQAAMIVLHYGIDQPELLIEMIDGNLEELCEMLGVNNEHAYSHRMRLCIWLMVKKVIPENREAGHPDILDISDILSIDSSRRRELRRYLGEELPDALSGSSRDLDLDSQRFLRRNGVI